MGFDYKKVLLIGATSGIGAALAETLVENGVFVIGVGRRRERLESFAQKHGSTKTDYRVFDVNDTDTAQAFVDEIFSAHPDISFVFLNSGIQRGLDFTNPSKVDLSTLELELKTNYTAPVHLTNALLPYLTRQSSPTALAYTTTQLAIITLNSRPNYGASKAALHHFILALRAQISKSSPSLKIIEVFPPAVQTELHDSKNQPDLKNGDQIGMPLKEFNDERWEGLKQGKEDVVVGSAKPIWEAVEPPRREESKKFNDVMDEALKDFLA
ncbi:hypothetical protein M409DRAFT_26736 [Zasmidium cellare ATCC 36951]|uniref:Uncharacterized protein n=1 Tax=Zasmidium cellare ATCC 36951 TaxID=1080233 RepID=A0A6A6C752_ZASCE|nr:uncharacterized protein M409DRAFT_26736 [Zasmidium cellare ATCC 36951]KAF2162881.1 hypothetical protein M409DRAFT_26736 [Zasmidium cellare ATCC 36951]